MPDQAANQPSDSELLDQLKEPLKSSLPNFGDLKCTALLASVYGVQAIAAIKAAKETGVIRDEDHCLLVAGDVNALGDILGGQVAGLIAGDMARCACRLVF